MNKRKSVTANLSGTYGQRFEELIKETGVKPGTYATAVLMEAIDKGVLVNDEKSYSLESTSGPLSEHDMNRAKSHEREAELREGIQKVEEEYKQKVPGYDTEKLLFLARYYAKSTMQKTDDNGNTVPSRRMSAEEECEMHEIQKELINRKIYLDADEILDYSTDELLQKYEPILDSDERSRSAYS